MQKKFNQELKRKSAKSSTTKTSPQKPLASKTSNSKKEKNIVVTKDNRKKALLMFLSPIIGTFLVMIILVIALIIIDVTYLQSTSAEKVMLWMVFAIFLITFIFTITLFIISFFVINKKEISFEKYDQRSGREHESIIPAELKGWNWGAAGLPIAWGFYHRTWIAFLKYMPVIGIFWWIYLGIKGNELAWKVNRWKSVEEFKETQLVWAPFGIIGFFLGFILVILYIAFLVFLELAQTS